MQLDFFAGGPAVNAVGIQAAGKRLGTFLNHFSQRAF